MEIPVIDIQSDEYFMREAMRQARRAAEREEVPVGAVMVKEGRIIARAYNQVELLKDATAHAEMLVITQAAEVLEDWRLVGCTLFVTKEPCPMCSGAVVLSRVDRLVFGVADSKAGGAGGLFQIVSNAALNHRVAFRGGVLAEECAALLKGFFLTKRKQSE